MYLQVGAGLNIELKKKPLLLFKWNKQYFAETGVNIATEMWINLVTNVRSVQFYKGPQLFK